MKIRFDTFLLLFLYIYIAGLFYIFIGERALRGELSIQFYADSLTYEKLAKEYDKGSHYGLIDVDLNFFGPYILLKTFNFNRSLIIIFNYSLFILSISLLIKHFNLNQKKFLFFIFINPVVFSSLFLVNKEIISFFVISLLFSYYKNRKTSYIVLSLFISLLVRWQLTFFMIVFITICSGLNPFRERRYLTFITLLFIISISYPFTLKIFAHLDEIAKEGARTATEGTGLYSKFLLIQNKYGYFLVFIPKTLLLLIGLIARFKSVMHLSMSNFYNYVFILGQSFAFLYLIINLILKRRISFNNQIFYLAIIYCAIFAISPIYAPRYFLPVYIAFALILSLKSSKIYKNNIKKKENIHR